MKTIISPLKSIAIFSLIAFILVLFGCKPGLLPSTNITATPENRRIVTFLEQYKAASEKRSVDALMELVAKDFKDNAGSEDPAVHLDYLSLKEKLEKIMPRIKDLRLGLFIQHVQRLEKDTYEVVFYFTKHILMEVPAGEKWFSVKEVNRMLIRRRHDSSSPYEFEILQGI